MEFVHHAAPKDAPAWAQDIGEAWNALERAEVKKNATLALEYVGSFPHQLNQQQREFILKDFVREEFTRKGFMATAAIHSPSQDGDERNYHTHIMFSYRTLDENGFAKTKDRRFSSYESREATLDQLKGKWAELGARQLERQGLTVEAGRWRHGHKTLAEQRAAALARGDTAYAEECAREPTKHLGPVATEIERDGRASHRGNENRAIEADNAERQQIKAGLADTDSQRAEIEQEPPPLALRRLESYGERKAARQANPTRDYSALRETHAQVAEAQDKTAASSMPPLDADMVERIKRNRTLLREELERARGGRER